MINNKKKPVKNRASKKAKKKSIASVKPMLPTHGENPIKAGYVVPGLPHYLLQPEKNQGWQQKRQQLKEHHLYLPI